MLAGVARVVVYITSITRAHWSSSSIGTNAAVIEHASSTTSPVTGATLLQTAIHDRRSRDRMPTLQPDRKYVRHISSSIWDIPLPTCGDRDGSGAGNAIVVCPTGYIYNTNANATTCASTSCNTTTEDSIDTATCCQQAPWILMHAGQICDNNVVLMHAGHNQSSDQDAASCGAIAARDSRCNANIVTVCDDVDCASNNRKICMCAESGDQCVSRDPSQGGNQNRFNVYTNSEAIFARSYTLLGHGFARTSADQWYCWINYRATSATDCQSGCTDLPEGNCYGFTFDHEATGGTDSQCNLYAGTCSSTTNGFISTGNLRKGPWTSAPAQTSGSPISATTYLKRL